MIPEEAKWYTSKIFMLDLTRGFAAWDDVLQMDSKDAHADGQPLPLLLDAWLDLGRDRGFIVDSVTPIMDAGQLPRILVIMKRRIT